MFFGVETLRIPSVWLQLTRLWCSPEFCEAYDGSGKKNRPAPCTPWIVATCSWDKSLGNIWGKVGNAKTRIETMKVQEIRWKRTSSYILIHTICKSISKLLALESRWSPITKPLQNRFTIRLRYGIVCTPAGMKCNFSPGKTNVAKPKGCEVAISPNLSDVRDGSTVHIWRFVIHHLVCHFQESRDICLLHLYPCFSVFGHISFHTSGAPAPGDESLGFLEKNAANFAAPLPHPLELVNSESPKWYLHPFHNLNIALLSSLSPKLQIIFISCKYTLITLFITFASSNFF